MANQLRTSGVFNLGSLGGDSAAVSADADFDSVVLLLDGDGTSGSTTFTDKSNASPTITVNGDTQVTTSVKKFGSGSIDFDGTGDYLEVDFENNIGASGEAFTVECWVYFDTYYDDGVINLTQGGFGQGSNSLAIGYFSGQWRFYDDNTSTATGVTPGPSTGQWYHVAIVFNGTNLVFYVDGTARLTRSNHASNIPSGGYPTVIFGGYFSSVYLMDGKIDDIRVTKGVARYTGSFTPPAALPTPVAGATRPTRKWGGLVGRSIIADADADITGAEILLVGGGGAGGGRIGGGGGAGAMIELTNQTLTIGQSYSLTVGAGGLGKINTAQPDDGGDTTGFTYTATGGGYGGVYQYYSGNSGGSGGGGSGLAVASNPYTGGGATDNSSYGNAGGNGAGTATSQNYCAGGGGGRSGAGANGNSSTGVGGIGGTAKQWAVDSQYHAGGGQGAPHQDTTNPATSYGAGAGNSNDSTPTTRDATSHGTDGGYGNGGGGYRNVGDETGANNRGGNGYQGVIKVWVPIDGYTDYVAGTPANVSSSALTYNSTVGTLLTVTGDTTLTFN